MEFRKIFEKYIDLFVGIIVFGLSLGSYVMTLLPGVGWGDTAEWQTVPHVLGIPHTTGYPLYIFAGKLFTYLPFGNIAYRLNLMSAFFAAVAAFFVYLTVQKLTKDIASAVASGLIFAFSNTLWSQAVIAEVYTFNAFFVSSVIFFMVMWRLSRNLRWFLIATVLYAFSFGNHLTMITMVPAIFFYILVTDLKIFINWKAILVVVLAIILSASMYLYIPYRSAQDPVFHWIKDWRLSSVENWDGFKDYISGTVFFKKRMFSISMTELPKREEMYVKFLSEQFPWVSIVAGIFGAWEMIKIFPVSFLFLALIFLGNLAFSMSYQIFDIYVYFIPSYLIISIFMGFTFDEIKKVSLRPVQAWLITFKNKKSAMIIFNISVVIISLVLLFLPYYVYVNNYSKVDRSRDKSAEIYAREFLSGLDRSSVALFAGWNKAMAVRYMQYCEGLRSDVKLIYAFRGYWPGYIQRYFNTLPVYTFDYDTNLTRKFVMKREKILPSLSDIIDLVPSGRIVILAVEEDGSKWLSGDDVQAIRSTGGKVDLRSKLQYSHALIGVKGATSGTAIESSEKGATTIMVRKGERIGKTSKESPVDIVASSAGFDYGNYGYIYVNNKEVASRGTGYHVVIVNSQTGEVEKSASVDTSEPPMRVRIVGMYEDGVLKLARQVAPDAKKDLDLPAKEVVFYTASSRKYLLTGWGGMQDWGSWGIGDESKVVFHLGEPEKYFLHLRVKPNDELSPLPSMKIYLNSQLIEEVKFSNEGWQTIKINLDAQLFTGEIETLSFVYDYTAPSTDSSAKKKVSQKQAVVGFEYIRFSPE